MPEHGKAGTYNHGCHCLDCTEAHRIRHAQTSRILTLRAARGDPQVPHGTVGGYKNWGCKCADCTAANSAASRDYYHRTKGLRGSSMAG